ncbi:MAG: S1C family serine protease [Dehalococcoidia bacterium]
MDNRTGWRWLAVALLMPALVIAGCRGDDDQPPALTEDVVRQIVREESAPSVETIRQITREEIAKALAAQESSTCEAGAAVARVLPSIVEVQVYRPNSAVLTGRGTGFVALAGGIVVTAAHVVGDAATVELVVADGRHVPAEVIKRDSERDLAVLRAADRTLPPVKWGDPAAIALGTPVRIVGYPSGFGLTVTGGVLAGRMPSAAGVSDLLVTDTAIDHGNSGGPLLTECGEALGVVVERRLTSTAVNAISVSAATALPFVLTAATESPPSPAPSPIPRTPTATPTRTP